ncbi:hypothetical protein IE81DRAFT_242041 [Ceraceosorus guamensis]|uniref:Uncharacterized protein n=1 Tax=Ceraceosorus guamensis TaxID=1522189 RepID=A0A316W4L5_9BASI|nr:hypothetical protein IE81DRAFT_242041 [Ceraceosorus guamensis]PWN44887.1 hypothetical protein IE81DRAFT_242041 [Ceraceosorus guamensis]
MAPLTSIDMLHARVVLLDLDLLIRHSTSTQMPVSLRNSSHHRNPSDVPLRQLAPISSQLRARECVTHVRGTLNASVNLSKEAKRGLVCHSLTSQSSLHHGARLGIEISKQTRFGSEDCGRISVLSLAYCAHDLRGLALVIAVACIMEDTSAVKAGRAACAPDPSLRRSRARALELYMALI